MTKSADGDVSSQLSLASVSWEDEGVYTCVAVEAGAEEDTAPAKQNILLDVLGKKGCSNATSRGSHLSLKPMIVLFHA